jgi:antitoxin component HigA of HigAB toxin-antitoxin module
MLALEAEAIPIPGWTPNEIALVLQGFNKYGEDFEAISQVIGSKTDASIKAFYNYYKENLNLDKLILNNPVRQRVIIVFKSIFPT